MKKQIAGQITFEDLDISLGEENARRKLNRQAKRESDQRRKHNRNTDYEYDLFE